MKNLIQYLSKAVAKPQYNLYLEFEDVSRPEIGLHFKSFKITKDKKLQWNEDIDMDPDAFYLQLIGKTFEEYAGNKQLLWDSH